jgi:hypothetical protein
MENWRIDGFTELVKAEEQVDLGNRQLFPDSFDDHHDICKQREI